MQGLIPLASGMDHAVATQARFERLRGRHFRYDLGREKFLESLGMEDEYATTIKKTME